MGLLVDRKGMQEACCRNMNMQHNKRCNGFETIVRISKKRKLQKKFVFTDYQNLSKRAVLKRNYGI